MAANNPFLGQMEGAWGSSSGAMAQSPPRVVTASVAVGSQGLNEKEVALAQKEAELKRMEVELRAAGGGQKRKNWPPLCPCMHHDIAGEVPAEARGAVRAAYAAYLGLVLCLVFNFVGSIALLIGVGGSHLSSFLWAGLYVIGGVPGALLLWYRRLYNNRSDSAMGHLVFFLGFLAHLVFSGWSAIAPPVLMSWSHTGVWSGIEVMDYNKGVGTIYLIGAGLWTVESLWSFWVLRLVYSGFRGRGEQAAQPAPAAAAAV